MSKSPSSTPTPGSHNITSATSSSAPRPTTRANPSPRLSARSRSRAHSQRSLTPPPPPMAVALSTSHIEQPSPVSTHRSGSKTRELGDADSPGSSQGGLADNETEGDSAPSQTSFVAATTAPVKKKRTRTLTTPHQSAVLHALLAQSRFPTTAMREEVGRSIGLSARKVQIWFQNQRQKARRPQREANRQAQIGASQIAGNSLSTTQASLSAVAGTSAMMLQSGPMPFTYSTPSGRPPGSLEPRAPNETTATFRALPLSFETSGMHLVGPGMPGSVSAPSATLPLMETEPDHRRSSPHSNPRPSMLDLERPHAPRSESPAQITGHQTSFYSSVFLGYRGREASRTLAPLDFGYHLRYRDLPSSSGSASGPGSVYGPSSSSSYATMSPISPSFPRDRPSSSNDESSFTRQIADRSMLMAPLASTMPLSIPPPTPLQPLPMWDSASFSGPALASRPWPSPPSSSHSHSPSGLPHVLEENTQESPVTSPRRRRRESSPPFLESPVEPPRRRARFDPVRESQVLDEEPQSES